MYPRAIGLRGVGFGGRIAAASCVIYFGLVFSARAIDRVPPVSTTVLEAKASASRFLPDDSRKAKHFPAARRISRRATLRPTDLSGDSRCRESGSAPLLFVVDLVVFNSRTVTTIGRPVRPVQSSYCLQEQIRERAPPILENPI
jgi:hypothetical protein